MTTTNSPKVEWIGYSWTVNGHSTTCVGVALENLAQNLQTDGQPNAWDVNCPDDLAWGIPAAELVVTWLSDGTTPCYCDDEH